MLSGTVVSANISLDFCTIWYGRRFSLVALEGAPRKKVNQTDGSVIEHHIFRGCLVARPWVGGRKGKGRPGASADSDGLLKRQLMLP